MKSKKITKGEYLYRGYKLINIGYISSEKSVVWEALDDDGYAHFHAFTKSRLMAEIDLELDTHYA